MGLDYIYIGDYAKKENRKRDWKKMPGPGK